jgi:hypothetical protein
MSADRERSTGGDAYLFPRHPSEVDRLDVHYRSLLVREAQEEWEEQHGTYSFAVAYG